MNSTNLRGWFKGCSALLLCFALVGFAGLLQAQQVTTRQVEVSAAGVNEMDAIVQALVSAVHQVGGTRVGGVSIAVVRDSIRDNKVTSAAELARVTAAVTQGAVKSYEVLESGKEQATAGQSTNATQQWKVRLRVNVATYSAGAQLKRLRLAVVPVQLPAALRTNPGAKKFAIDFSEKLETLLTQSRRFAMLDRQFADVVDKELAQYKSDAFSAEETARIGKKAGTDYLVVGALSKYEIVDQSIHMSMSDRTIPRKTARAVLQLRLIDVATGQIKYAKIFDTGDHTARTSSSAEGMLGSMAEKASSEIISSVYPIAVVAADASSVTLGQGGDTIKAGQRFQVYALGETLKDPYTGESLGRRESAVGMIEVTSVTDRLSTGKILDGSAAIAGAKDMIVRMATSVAAPAPAMASPSSAAKSSAAGAAKARGAKPGAAKGDTKEDKDW